MYVGQYVLIQHIFGSYMSNGVLQIASRISLLDKDRVVN